VIILVLNHGHWGLMLQIGYYSKSSWKNFYLMSLLIGCYDSTSSKGFCSRAYGDCSLAIVWEMISTSSSESKMTIILGFGAIIELVVIIRKLKVTSNSFSQTEIQFSFSTSSGSSLVIWTSSSIIKSLG
jgi:hypothetical protein